MEKTKELTYHPSKYTPLAYKPTPTKDDLYYWCQKHAQWVLKAEWESEPRGCKCKKGRL